MQENIRIVMVNTSHPGNIGAVARAMKNMCLTQLYLVQPKIFPSQEATARSSGAIEILENAMVCDSLEEALADCIFAVGSSARLRTVNWPQFNPRECGEKIVTEARQGKVALVMGREQSGLTNEELDLCQALVHIPSNPEYNSLNVAMAVQVFAYEILNAMNADLPAEEQEREMPSNEQMQHFFEHLHQTLSDVRFIDKRSSDKLMRRLKRFFYRADPDLEEVNIFRGILSAAQGNKFISRNKK